MKVNPSFSLRRLEMAAPLLKDAEKNDPKALVSLAAISMADESTLKLVAAGNTEALNVYTEQAYDMDAEEVAEVLHFFIRGCQRFTHRLNGLKPEEVNQVMTKQSQQLRVDMGLGSPDA